MITILTAASVVTGAAAAIVTELQNTPQSGGVPANMRICPLVPGEVAWDGCDCGQLALTIVDWYPSENFPNEATNDSRNQCDPYARAVDVQASLVRCIPGMDNAGNPPTPGALLAAAQIQQADAWTMEKAVMCYLFGLKRSYTITNYRVGRLSFVGPQGNCGGSVLPFSFALV